MSDDTMTSKEALFALETTMEEDMQDYGDEITMLAIKTINKDPELYKDIKFGRIEDTEYTADTIKDTCVKRAKNNNDQFGDLFITELEDVDWAKVMRIV